MEAKRSTGKWKRTIHVLVAAIVGLLAYIGLVFGLGAALDWSFLAGDVRHAMGMLWVASQPFVFGWLIAPTCILIAYFAISPIVNKTEHSAKSISGVIE